MVNHQTVKRYCRAQQTEEPNRIHLLDIGYLEFMIVLLQLDTGRFTQLPKLVLGAYSLPLAQGSVAMEIVCILDRYRSILIRIIS